MIIQHDTETEKNKRAIVEQLKRTPTVQLAVEKVGIGRSTYYAWRKDDTIFARAADKAKEAGRFFVNDIAESRLMSLIQGDNLTAIIFWLKHNHPTYANKIIHEYMLGSNPPSIEEDYFQSRRYIRMAENKLRDRKLGKLKRTDDDIRRDIEAEELEADNDEKTLKEMGKYNDDLESK